MSGKNVQKRKKNCGHIHTFFLRNFLGEVGALVVSVKMDKVKIIFILFGFLLAVCLGGFGGPLKLRGKLKRLFNKLRAPGRDRCSECVR